MGGAARPDLPRISSLGNRGLRARGQVALDAHLDELTTRGIREALNDDVSEPTATPKALPSGEQAAPCSCSAPGLERPGWVLRRGPTNHRRSDFGGVPRVLLYDNLKSAVIERRGDAIRFHPTLLDLSKHYRFEPRPVAPARRNEKGRVERAIRYVREGFFEARAFDGLADLNRQAGEWTSRFAMDRTWVEDRARTVRQAFDEEREKLLPFADDGFPAFERCEVEVGKTPYVRFDLNDYSVPHDRVNRTLVVFADMETVRITDGKETLATHKRSWDRGEQIELAVHLERLTDEKRRAREHRGLDRLARAARSSQGFLRALAERGGTVGSTTARLLVLLDAVGPLDLEEALIECLERDAIHLGAVRQVCDRRRSERGLPQPISVPVTRAGHALVSVTPHSLSTYDTLKEDRLECGNGPMNRVLACARGNGDEKREQPWRAFLRDKCPDAAVAYLQRNATLRLPMPAILGIGTKRSV